MFPIIVPPIEMTIQANYTAILILKQGFHIEKANEIIQQTISTWSFGPDKECRERRASANILFRIKGQPDPFNVSCILKK